MHGHLRPLGSIGKRWWLAAILVLMAVPVRPQSGGGLQPYILVGESGRSLKRTSGDIVARLFLLNYRLLGQYHPGGDPNREVLVMTHPALLRSAAMEPLNGMLTAVCRIAIHERGGLTYVYVQNMTYWARAAFRGSYPAVEPAMETFMRAFVGALPRFRGQFNRPYGGNRRQPVSPQRLLDYKFSRRSEGLDDKQLIAGFPSQQEAVAAVRRVLTLDPHLNDLFTLESNDGSATIIGFSNSGLEGEKYLLAILEVDDLDYAAAFPLELLVSGGQVFVLPLRYRLPLGSPGMSRRTFRRLKKVQADYYRAWTALLKGEGAPE